jgi:hypothetical protein
MSPQASSKRFQERIRMKAFIAANAILLTMLGTVARGQYGGSFRNHHRQRVQNDQNNRPDGQPSLP